MPTTMLPNAVDPRDAHYRTSLSQQASAPTLRLHYPSQTSSQLLQQARLSTHVSPPSTKSLFISGLNDNITAEYLRRKLQTLAPVREVFVPEFKGARLGLALVHLPSAASPQAFVRQFNNSKLAGQTMVVVYDYGGRSFKEVWQRTCATRSAQLSSAPHPSISTPKLPSLNNFYPTHPPSQSLPPPHRSLSKPNKQPQHPPQFSSPSHFNHDSHISIRPSNQMPLQRRFPHRSTYRDPDSRRVPHPPIHSSRYAPYQASAAAPSPRTATYNKVRGDYSTRSPKVYQTATKRHSNSFSRPPSSASSYLAMRFALLLKIPSNIKCAEIAYAYAHFRPRQCFMASVLDCILTFPMERDRDGAFTEPPSFSRERRISIWRVDIPAGVTAEKALERLVRRENDSKQLGSSSKMDTRKGTVIVKDKRLSTKPESENEVCITPRSTSLGEKKRKCNGGFNEDEVMSRKKSKIHHADDVARKASLQDISYTREELLNVVFENMMQEVLQHILVLRNKRLETVVNKAVLQSVSMSLSRAKNGQVAVRAGKSSKLVETNVRSAEGQRSSSTHANLDDYLDGKKRVSTGACSSLDEKVDCRKQAVDDVNETRRTETRKRQGSLVGAPPSATTLVDTDLDGSGGKGSRKRTEKAEIFCVPSEQRKSRFSRPSKEVAGKFCEGRDESQSITQGKLQRHADQHQVNNLCDRNDRSATGLSRKNGLKAKAKSGTSSGREELTGAKSRSLKRKNDKEADDELQSTSAAEIERTLKPQKRPRRGLVVQQCGSDVTPESSVGASCGSGARELEAVREEQSLQAVEDEQMIEKTTEKVVPSDTESEDNKNGGQSARTAGYTRKDWDKKEPQDLSMYHRQRDQSCHSSRDNRLQNRLFRKCISGINVKQDLFNANSLKQRKKHVQFRKSRIHGMGLFVCEAVEAGEFIIEYVGESVRWQVCNIREERYKRRGMGDSYLFRLDNNVVIDATQKGCIARFINHSCDPNIMARIISVDGQNRIVFYSKRHIKADEELTYDYKFDYEEEDKKISCLCGASNCRKFLN